MLLIDIKEKNSGYKIYLSGELNVSVSNKAWNPLNDLIDSASKSNYDLEIDLSGLTTFDLSGAAQLIYFISVAKAKGFTVSKQNIPDKIKPIFEMAVKALSNYIEPVPPKQSFFESIGLHTKNLINDLKDLICFTGELLDAFYYYFTNPSKIRWRMVFSTVEIAGVNSLPIVCLIAFLIGLIMAFQGAVPLKIFGADVYVSYLIGISIVRELGPLMTAIVLAARSGSAFSAELAAMKIGQEIDAITTMGLNPVRFLIFPRVFGTLLINPLITVIASFAGLIGGNVVIFVLGYPLETYWSMVAEIVDLSDLFTGLFKSLFFAIIVAAVSCQRGMSVSSGADAVGSATTKGVVSNIILLAVFDSIFAVLFYILGI